MRFPYGRTGGFAAPEYSIVPLLARANPYGDGYELIAGHRRKAACNWAGLAKVPVVVRNLDDNQAVIAMVDSKGSNRLYPWQHGTAEKRRHR